MRAITQWLVLAIVVSANIPIAVAAKEIEVPLEKLPPAVKSAVTRKFPQAELIKAILEEDEDEEKEYEVTIKDSGKKIDVTVEEEGEIVGLEKELQIKDLPAAVAAALRKVYSQAVIQSAEAVFEIEDGKEELEYYEVAIKTAAGEVIEVKVKDNGTIINDHDEEASEWTSDFSQDKETLTHMGKNPYFILEPGYQLVFAHGDEQVVKTVMNETRRIDGIECRVVEERETKNGQLVEVSRNFLAISTRTNSVYYFGEEVDEYKDGKVVGHKGSWLAGSEGAKFGLMMPGVPLINARFYQEIAPKLALDRAEIVAVGLTLKTPAGEFKNCVKMEETTPLEPKNVEYKVYAPGVGLIQDGEAQLVKFGKIELPNK